MVVVKRNKVKNNSGDNKDAAKKGVILLSHIPHGFYEHQMMRFFSQFGEVTRLKLVRSRKTGGSRHFAFIEFQHEEVAKIAAETMNFYLMFRKVLKCKFIPQDEVKKGTFYKWKDIYKPSDNRKKQILSYNKAIFDVAKIARRKRRSLEKRAALQKKLQGMGIDYDVMNVKTNASFVPPRRSRASLADVKDLRKISKVHNRDGRCVDFDYSDDDGDDDNEEEKDKDVCQFPVSSRYFESPAVDRGDDVEESLQMTDDFNVMVVDSDDSEITFKTPPADARIKRMALKKLRIEARSKRKNMLLRLQQSLDSDNDMT